MAIETRAGGGARPRVRVNADDLVPEQRPVLEVVHPADEDGPERTRIFYGYVWGPRIPGLREARVLQDWNRGRDPETGLIEDPLRRREVLEEAVLNLVDHLDSEAVANMSSTDLVAILQDLGFLKPPEEAPADSAPEDEPVPPQEAMASSI